MFRKERNQQYDSNGETQGPPKIEYRQFPNLIRLARGAIAVALLAGLLVGCGNSSTINTATSTPGARIAAISNSATWSAQLNLAQSEAAKIDKDAVLQVVQADSFAQQGTDGRPLEAAFIFMRPDGERISVRILASDPPSVVRLRPIFDLGPAPAPEELHRFTKALSTVELGPQEAYEKTLDAAKPFIMAAPVDVSVGLHLDSDLSEKIGITTAWFVTYSVFEESTQGIPMKPQQLLSFLVNPQTGQIMQRNVLDFTATPTLPASKP